MTAALRLSARDMIAAKGQTVTITRRASGSYDTATGAASITTSAQTVKAVILPLAPYRKGDTNVTSGDETALVSGIDTAGAILTAPHIDDTLTDVNGKVYTIIAADKLAPDGLAIIYDLILRGHM